MANARLAAKTCADNADVATDNAVIVEFADIVKALNVFAKAMVELLIAAKLLDILEKLKLLPCNVNESGLTRNGSSVPRVNVLASPKMVWAEAKPAKETIDTIADKNIFFMRPPILAMNYNDVFRPLHSFPTNGKSFLVHPLNKI